MYRLYLLFLITAIGTQAQVYNLSDEELLKLSSNNQTEQQLDALEELCWREAIKSKSRLQQYAKKALDISSNPEYRAKIFNHLSLGELNFGDLDSAVFFAKKGLELREKAGNKREMASSYTRLGQIYREKGDFDEAASYLFKALEIFEKQDDKPNISRLYDNIGALFKENQQLKKALEYHEKAYKIGLEVGDSSLAALALGNIAVIYLKEQNHSAALSTNKKILSQFKPFIRKIDLSVLYQNIGVSQASLEKVDSALFFYEKSASLYREMDNYQGLAFLLPNIGNQWLKKKEFGKAKKNMQEGLHYAYQINNLRSIFKAHESISQYYYASNKSDSAYYHLQKTKFYSDSIFNLEKTSALNDIQTRYETEKKEKELLANSEQIALQQLAIEEKSKTVNLIVFVFIVSGLLAMLYYLVQKQKQERKLKEAEIKIALEKAATENKIQADRLRISKELHDNIGAQLTFIKAKIGTLKSKHPEANPDLSSIDEFTQNTIDELRKTVWLVNHKNLGLEEFCIKIQDLYRKVPKIQVSYSIEEEYLYHEFDSLKGIHLFRFLQEAVNNALKYSESESIQIKLSTQGNQLTICIKDQGKGFDPKTTSMGYGIRNMQSRIQELLGHFEINSELEKGTEIKAIIQI